MRKRAVSDYSPTARLLFDVCGAEAGVEPDALRGNGFQVPVEVLASFWLIFIDVDPLFDRIMATYRVAFSRCRAKPMDFF